MIKLYKDLTQEVYFYDNSRKTGKRYLGCSERNVYRNIQSGKLEAVEREVMIPTLKKFVTEEALEKYKAGRAS